MRLVEMDKTVLKLFEKNAKGPFDEAPRTAPVGKLEEKNRILSRSKNHPPLKT